MDVGQITTIDFLGNEKFAIGRVIQGGMGTVYQLVPIKSDARPIALKTLQSVMSIRDFERECNAWLSVAQHRNIARALAFGKWQGAPAIVVDWYPGSMADLNVDKYGDDFVIKLVKGLLSALDFAHSSVGLVHQDIKPENVLVDADGQARLSDFGLARCIKSRATEANHQGSYGVTSLSQSSEAEGGTPFYMAPELFAGAVPSIKSDMFSLGVTLFKFLTGEHPYFGQETRGRTHLQLRSGILTRFLSRRGRAMSPLGDFVLRCLSLEPGDRPGNYRAIGVVDNNSSSPEAGELVQFSRIRAVVAQAMFFRERRDFPSAERVLREQLKAYPRDPVLLNALGALADKRGQKATSLSLFSEAFEHLRQTSGLLYGSVYADPAINLAGHWLCQRKHDDAYAVLQIAWRWITIHQPSIEQNWQMIPRLDRWYSEFGWMLLYAGKFAEAADYLAEVTSKKGSDKMAAYWLLEAAWMGNCLKDHANLLVRSLVNFAPSDSAAALCGCLTAQFANLNLAREMLMAISADRRSEIAAAEREASMGSNALLYPRNVEAQKLIVRSLDDLVTGGRHNGLV